MEQQFSPGLLYSVAPEDFSELHLQDDEKTDELEWEVPASRLCQFAQAVRSVFAKSAKDTSKT